MTSPLVSAEDLAHLLSGPAAQRPLLLDVRYSGPAAGGGYDAYLAGHLPGARYLDLDSVLADPPGGTRGRHPLPSTERFEAGMRAAGVDDGVPVVVYDDWSSIAAARAWWLLRHFGHQGVRVLDGGLGAWRAADLPLKEGQASSCAGDFRAGEPRLTVVDADGAAALAARGALLDGRPAGRFRGEGETIDPVAGHIPGARSLPAVELVDAAGALLPAHDLRARFDAVGVGPDSPAAAYCGSGVQACHVALAAAVAGITDDLGLYPASWSGWVADPQRPVQTGS